MDVTTGMKLEKNDIIDIKIDDLGMNGEGIAHYSGVTVFIKGALVGERIRAKIIFIKPTFYIAIIMEILEAAPSRKKPFCTVFGKCGGCSLQHLDYNSQLEYKRNQVKNCFTKQGMQIEIEGVVPSPKKEHYRNKMSLPVGGGAETSVGFYAAASHRIVPIIECPIQFEQNGKLIRLFLDFMREHKLKGYDEASGKGDVRHLVARRLCGTTYVTVVTPRASLPQIEAFNDMLVLAYGNKYALYLNYNGQKNNIILGDKTQQIGGTQEPITIDELKIRIHPKSFFQVNDGVREKLYAAVASEVSGTVLDAYSGSGVLSAILAQKAERVIAVEIEGAAVDSAIKLKEDNAIHNLTVICGDCAQEVPKIVKNNILNCVVLDPPRAGCDRAVLDAVVKSEVNKIIYVSCNAATLARDCAALLQSGYILQSVSPYDMFPHSSNIETLAVLERKEKK